MDIQLVNREQAKVKKDTPAVDGSQLIGLKNVTKAYEVASGEFVALKKCGYASRCGRVRGGGRQVWKREVHADQYDHGH